MADLTGQQLKDSYQNLLTIDATIESNPTSGQLENGLGNAITALGIGTDSPTDALNISSASNQIGLDTGNQATYGTLDVGHFTNGAFIGTQAGSNTVSDLLRLGTSGTERFKIHSSGDISFRDGSASEAFYWDASAGSLGIGTTDTGNAGFSVSKSGDGGNNVYARINGVATANEAGLQFADQNTLKWTLYKPGSSNNLNFYNHTGGSIAMTLDASGNVGIGATSTTGFDSGADNLIIGSGSSSTGMTIYSGTSGYGSLHFADANSSPANYVGYVNYNHSTNSMQFATDSTERMRIDSSGNVGIGCSPSQVLSIESSSATPTRATITNTGNASAGAGVQFITKSGGSQVSNATVRTDNAGNFSIFTGTTSEAERMRIDSDGNVGIGTDSPTSGNRLHIKDSDAQIELEATGSGTSNSGFLDFDGTSLQLSTNRDNKTGTFHDSAKSHASVLLVGSDGGSYIRFNTAAANNTTATERMRITSGGDIQMPLATNAQGNFVDNVGEVGSGNFCLQVSNTAQSALKPLGFRAEDIRFATGSSERMRIDSSGNVLVGKTSADLDTVGAELRPNGVVGGTVSDGNVLWLNRTTSDGNIVNFSKDGTTVGTIGTKAGDLTIGDADVGIRFDTGTGLVPWNLSTNLSTDNAIDIGASSARFKDLYLGGFIRINNSDGAHVGNQDGVTVTTSATTIASQAGDLGRLWVVNGIDGGNRFCDLVMASTSVSPVVVQSFTSAGSPSARTYTRSGVTLQLAMASGSYGVSCISFGRT